MIRNLLSRRRSGKPDGTFPPPTAPGLVYAVGDIHGRADLLEALLERIAEDRQQRPAATVFLGDYVDRGEQSRAVLDILTGRARQDEDAVFLMGNHEQMLLDFVAEPGSGRDWLVHGGLQTLASYGVALPAEPEGLAHVRDRLVEAMGPHLAFLRDRLRLAHRRGNVLFVHAAADPGLPPNRQPPETLLWGAPAFAGRARDDGIWVVHGHTVVSAPHGRDGRIAIDTGAYFSGRLTAARLEGGTLGFLST